MHKVFWLKTRHFFAVSVMPQGGPTGVFGTYEKTATSYQSLGGSVFTQVSLNYEGLNSFLA